MMSESDIEPVPVIDLVERYVYRELSDFERYTNRKPFDSSGVAELHQLARDIYACGVKDGAMQEAYRNSRQRQRDEAKAANSDE
ncbi:hypothetical protein [Nocardia asiatica]